MRFTSKEQTDNNGFEANGATGEGGKTALKPTEPPRNGGRQGCG